MKKGLVFIATILFVLGVTIDTAYGTNGKGKVGAKIVFVQSTHEFGTVKQNGPCEYTFVYKNKGDEPLVVNKVLTSCGCVGTTVGNNVTLPGAKGTIKVKYNTSLTGDFRKMIVVKTNSKYNSNVVLTISGKVVASKTKKTKH